MPSSLQRSETEVSRWYGGLRETHLSFGEREFSSALATARSRGGETRHGALSDQIPLELGQGGEDSEHHATGRSRGVDLSGHCCKVSDEAAFCLIQRPYISKTLLTRRISPRGSP